MNNSKRSIGFTIAFMSVISLLIIILPNINTGMSFNLVFPNIIFFLFVLVFAFIQYIFRLIITSKHFVKDKLLFDLELDTSKTYSRMVAYSFALFIFLWPVIGSKNWTSLSVTGIINFLLWLLIIEIMLLITYKYTKLYFMTDGILIRGIDLRLDLPMNDEIRSYSGFYSYEDIDSFSSKNNTLKLFLYQDRGSLEASLPLGKEMAIEEYLKSKKITRK